MRSWFGPWGDSDAFVFYAGGSRSGGTAPVLPERWQSAEWTDADGHGPRWTHPHAKQRRLDHVRQALEVREPRVLPCCESVPKILAPMDVVPRRSKQDNP